MTKHCNTCEKDHPDDNFHVRAASPDGLAARCKDCQKKYDKLRAMAPHRVQARAEYAKTDKGKKALNRAKNGWKKRNIEKRAAHIIMGNALRDGRISRSHCEKCGSQKSQAHHDDYAFPLTVRWLCSKHHAEHHRNEQETMKKEQHHDPQT